MCRLWHDIDSFPFSFWSLEWNRLKTPQTVFICIKLCQLYRAVWNCISYRVKSCINFCSDLYQSNSCTNFTALSDSFCTSLVRSVTVKSHNRNLAWPKLLYTNFSIQKLELYETKSFKNFMILVITWMYNINYITVVRGGSTNAATSKMELFVIIVNGWKLWLYKFLLFIYIFKLFIWRLFYLIARFIVLFYQVTYLLLDARR